MTFRTPMMDSWRVRVGEALHRNGHVKEAQEFNLCGSDDSVRAYRICGKNPSHSPHPISFSCHLRICPDCARREAARLSNRYIPAVEAVAAQEHEFYSLKLITLTRKVWLHDQTAWQQYYRTWKYVDQCLDLCLGENWHKKGMGYIASAEFGETGQKLHYHLLFYGPYIPQYDLSKAWHSLTGDPIVWINAVWSVGKAVREILKYATKLTVQAPTDVVKVLEIIKGSRRVRSRGCFYNIPDAEEQPEKVCRVCGENLDLWTVKQYNDWLESEARIEAHNEALSLLQFIPGNKSSPPARADTSQPIEKIGQTLTEWIREFNSAPVPVRRNKK